MVHRTGKLRNEQLISLTQAARSILKRPQTNALHRWRTHGIRGVRLEAVLRGGVWHTSTEALERFFGAAMRATCQTRSLARAIMNLKR